MYLMKRASPRSIPGICDIGQGPQTRERPPWRGRAFGDGDRAHSASQSNSAAPTYEPFAAPGGTAQIPDPMCLMYSLMRSVESRF